MEQGENAAIKSSLQAKMEGFSGPTLNLTDWFLQLPRMSWNKYNLYNAITSDRTLGRINETARSLQGLFAQRQQAKRLTRKYHGQGLRERIFTKQLYTSRFNLVAGGTPNQERYIWSGFYMNVERRLDTVIFRSLFATSIEQARQLIKHGHVDVNGTKVITPIDHCQQLDLD